MKNIIIYDCEIEKAIPNKRSEPLQDIEYCNGWHDFENMGISVICAFDYNKDSYRVFCKDNFLEFQNLVDASDLIVSFNGLAFDSKLCESKGIFIPDEKNFDILVEIWAAVGLGYEFEYPSHAGYSLDSCIKTNFPHEEKSGHGASTPIDWQHKKFGSVIDYCLNDVRITKLLFDKIMEEKRIISPKTGEIIHFENLPVISSLC